MSGSHLPSGESTMRKTLASVREESFMAASKRMEANEDSIDWSCETRPSSDDADAIICIEAAQMWD